jgi:hypothetical protein
LQAWALQVQGAGVKCKWWPWHQCCSDKDQRFCCCGCRFWSASRVCTHLVTIVIPISVYIFFYVLLSFFFVGTILQGLSMSTVQDYNSRWGRFNDWRCSGMFLMPFFHTSISIMGATLLIFYFTECPEANYGNVLQSYKILFYM